MNALLSPQSFDSLKRTGTAFFRALTFSRKAQAELLLALSEPMKVGRSPLDIAEHILKYGTRQQQEIASAIITSLGEGRPITDALQGWIEPMSLSALRAGEAGGADSFVLALETIANALKQSAEGRRGVLMLAAYPALILLATIIIMVVFIDPVVDGLRRLIGGRPNEELDQFSAVTHFYRHWLWLVILVIMGCVVGLRYYLGNAVTATRLWLDRAPGFSGYRLTVGANMVSTYALLKQFGMPSTRIFELLARVGGRYQRFHAVLMQDNLRSPSGETSEVSALDTGLLNPSHISLLHLYAGADDAVLIKALNAAAAAIRADIARRMRTFGILLALTVAAWAMFNVIMIIFVLMGFNPEEYF